MQQQVYIRLQSEMFCFWGSTPNPGGLSLCAGRQYKEKTVHAFDTLPPRSAGAQVAPQRCPILRADENSVTQIGEIINTTIKIVLDMGYTSEANRVMARILGLMRTQESVRISVKQNSLPFTRLRRSSN